MNTDKGRILFVDDDPCILKGLRRMLHSQLKEFNMHFVESAEEALCKLKKEHFDIIVSDMRMPEMNGIELLEKVKEEYPWMVRMILSGQASSEEIFRSINVTHRYLSKPCDATKLKTTLLQALLLRKTLSDPELIKIISQMDQLPSPPLIYREIIDELKCPDASLNDLGSLVAQDMGMSAKILQIVNSAFFGAPQKIYSPSKAVTFIGIDALKALTLSIGIFTSKQKTTDTSLWNNLWQHSIRTAGFAKMLASHEGLDKEEIDIAFTAALLHKIGILALMESFPEKYSQVLEMCKEEIPLVIAEKKVFGNDHGSIGGYQLRLWGLPDKIVEAVTFYADPDKSNITEFSPLIAVHIANLIDYKLNDKYQSWETEISNSHWLKRHSTDEKLVEWIKLCGTLNQKRGTFCD